MKRFSKLFNRKMSSNKKEVTEEENTPEEVNPLFFYDTLEHSPWRDNYEFALER